MWNGRWGVSERKKIESAARAIAHAAKALKTPGSSFCVVLWGPDENGQQWHTYVHDTAPAAGPDDTAACRRNLAAQLRALADTIESRTDVPPGVAGRG